MHYRTLAINSVILKSFTNVYCVGNAEGTVGHYIMVCDRALLNLHVMTEMHFLLQKNLKKYHAWSCQNVCDALTFLLDNIFVRFGTKLYRQVVGIPMGTNCAPLVADLFLFCYERDFMMPLSDNNQADVIDAFNTTSRYLDDILNINHVYFDNMVSQIYPSELQLNKANTSDTEAAFLDLLLKYFTDHSKAVLLLWIFYVFVLSCVCYVFVRVCLYVLCGHLLGKG